MIYLKKVHVGPFDSTITASISLKVNQSFDNSSFRKLEMAMILKIMGMNCKNLSIYHCLSCYWCCNADEAFQLDLIAIRGRSQTTFTRGGG